jgi:hypothetical protein
MDGFSAFLQGFKIHPRDQGDRALERNVPNA